jgi:hypothetical protein
LPAALLTRGTLREHVDHWLGALCSEFDRTPVQAPFHAAGGALRKLFILAAIVFALVSTGAATVVTIALTSDAAMALALRYSLALSRANRGYLAFVTFPIWAENSGI